MAILSPVDSSPDPAAKARLKALLEQPAAAQLLAALNRDKEEARIVGGAVRDSLMERIVGDVDVATTMLPQDIIATASNNGWKSVPTGVEHGTVTVVIDGVPHEVTTLRRDVQTDGRRAVVAFTRDFGEDAFRRDFTINALSLSVDGQVHDYAGGIADCQSGRVRFVGNADERIREDFLRILRFFRFHASHGRGMPDAEGLAASNRLKSGLERLSRERIRQELLKLLGARGVVGAVEAMDSIALWPVVLPGWRTRNDALGHMIKLESACSLKPDAILRLMAFLLGDPGTLRDMLKLSNADQKRVENGYRFAGDATADLLEGNGMLRLVHVAGPEAFADALLLHAAVTSGDPTRTAAMLARARPLMENPPANPFSSADLQSHGVVPGPRMGRILKRATKLWLDEGLPGSGKRQQAILARAVDDTPD